MDGMQILDILFRWLHVGTAIVLVGGTVFMRFVLMPSAEKLPTDAHDTLRSELIARWKRFVHAGILLLLVSGLYNYLKVAIPKHKMDPQKGLYHGLLGTKIILAFVVFFVASVLVGRSAKFEAMRQNRKKWLGFLVLLTAIIVAISGFVKMHSFS